MTSTRPVGEFDVKRIDALSRAIAGTVLLPGEDGFAEAGAGFNLNIVHAPALTIVAANAADVQAAVGFAVEQGLPLAVVHTGHQPFVPLTGGVLVRTGLLNSIEVDAANRTARVGAGALWQDIAREIAKSGLAALNGSSPTVGAAGYLTGGGASPIMGRTYGWAADHLREIEMVTADGELRRVTATSDPELFWAVRGGKGNFGIITSLVIDLFPLTTFFGGALTFDAEHTAELLHAYREFIRTVPDEMNSSLALIQMPPLPFIPEILRGRYIVQIRIAYLGSMSAGEQLVAPLRAVGLPLIDTLDDMPYADYAQVHQDPTEPIPYGEQAGLLTELTAEGVEVLLELVGPNSGSTMAVFEVRHLGGAFSRPPAVPNAVGNRDAGVSLLAGMVGSYEEQAADLARTNEVLRRLQPWSTGHRYINFMNGQNPVEEAYDTETFARLRQVKRAYDPANVFRLNNHNIPPAS